MSYTITSTEQNNESASDQETKALLYLMSFRKNSNDIYYYVIDFFNDVTGVDRAGSCAWDVQSKSSKNLSKSKIGKYLITLYKNYLSEFTFNAYILFVGGVSQNIIINKGLHEFNINNFKENAQKTIFKSLKDEAFKKNYIDRKLVNYNNINEFLSKVIFVIDNKNKADYIKKIIKVNQNILSLSDDYFNRIFDEIRDKQSAKKNICTENITINLLNEFTSYKKHLTSNELKMMVLSRLIHKHGVDYNPISFSIVLNEYKGEYDKKEILDDCKDSMARIMCDKNNEDAYWDLFKDICDVTIKNPTYTVNEIYNLLDSQKINKIQFLDIISTKFFIALVKDGVSE